MDIPSDLRALSALFEKFGATEPESWARSQIEEGIPQLQRFLFLRQAWKRVLSEHNTTWIDREISEAEKYPTGPYAGVGQALKRVVAAGASRQDLTDIARGVQAEMLFRLCYLLEDPDFRESELESFGWGLFEVDEDDNPKQPRIGSLHESVLETDPTGREMRPRAAGDA
jgi:hypothetical protein